MPNFYLKYTNSLELGNAFFRIFSKFSLLLALASCFLIHRIDFLIIYISYNLIFAWLYRKKIIRSTPGMLILLLHNLLYIQIPILFILSKDKDYNFSNFIIPPSENYYYYENLFFGILSFMFFFLFMIIGLIIGGKVTLKSPFRPLIIRKSQTMFFLILLGIFIFYISIIEISIYSSAKFNDVEKSENFIALLFNEKTYQLIFPILFYSIPQIDVRKSLIHFGIIVTIFLILDVLGGSKAALLQVFTSFFLTPLMIFYSSEKQIIWPKTKIFLIGGILIIPLFIFTMISRELSNTGIILTPESFVNLVKSSYDFNIQNIIDLISQRLSALLNNFLLVFTEFSGVVDINYRLNFIKYSFESFLNLILPGTPFPNSYVTTSQLFPLVLEKSALESGLDKVTLLKQANTQPYSIFGFLMVIGGPVFTTFFSFIFGFIFSFLYKNIANYYSKAIVMFVFFALFHCYAFETMLQFALMIIVTTFFFILIIKFSDRLKL
jgi:hypothetical protein